MLQLYKNIKKKRLELKMTQADLAIKLGYADKSMIAKIEKGAVDLTQSKIMAFAEALHTSPSELMGWDSDDAIITSKLSYTFDTMINENRPYVMLILSGICKTRRIEKNYTEKYVADKSSIALSEYLEFEEGVNIGLHKIENILESLSIEKKYVEYFLDQYCHSYDILVDLKVEQPILEKIAKNISKYQISAIVDDYNLMISHSKKHISKNRPAQSSSQIQDDTLPMAAHNDFANEEGQQELMQQDIDEL